MNTMSASKKHTPAYTPYTTRPVLPAGLAAFFNDVAPQGSILPARKCTTPAERPSAAPAMPYTTHGNEVSQMAELRIRQWIVQQEQDLRKQHHQRLFGQPKG